MTLNFRYSKQILRDTQRRIFLTHRGSHVSLRIYPLGLTNARRSRASLVSVQLSREEKEKKKYCLKRAASLSRYAAASFKLRTRNGYSFRLNNKTISKDTNFQGLTISDAKKNVGSIFVAGELKLKSKNLCHDEQPKTVGDALDIRTRCTKINGRSADGSVEEKVEGEKRERRRKRERERRETVGIYVPINTHEAHVRTHTR
ncbi:hypothetical protein PUN28_018556 [Cardiocondyla obscurior]|uniref:Uncharacterized protein n=1 Tax=Cardiocondyla obscurior TaxID=286306 RepID=A0AAW2EI83_9HYME